MASVRSLDNALEVEWIPGVSSSLAKVTEDDGTTIIPDAGRIIRNLIHGADTVMSHITHFYALAALDYVDASSLGPFFDPNYADSGILNIPAGFTMPNNASVAGNYVESLTMRRKAHTMSAILSGRHPIQNAIVPGGVTTMMSTCDLNSFSNLLDQVRNFINTAYIPDVVTVASTVPAHWSTGTNPGNLLSYGEYPIQTGTNAERLLLHRGAYVGGTPYLGLNAPTAFLANVKEYVGYSYYSSADGLAASAGATAPDVTKVGASSTYYSWLKAPRFDAGGTDAVCEVGPLPRMAVSYVVAATLGTGSTANPVVSEATGSLTTDGTTVTALTVPGLASPTLGGGTYSLHGMVSGVMSGLSLSTTHLISNLGRHATRALECKYLADAMAATASTDQAWLTELNTLGATSPSYVYAKIPKRFVQGAGWAEAPRGALGHWINIDKKRIANYQCVVPSTWNHSPRDTSGNLGAAEHALMNAALGSGTSTQILNILRHLHTYDFCIACAVHMVRPDGSTIAKVKMDTDGKVTKLPNDAEI